MNVTYRFDTETRVSVYNRPVAYAVTAIAEGRRVTNASKNAASARGYVRSWKACGYNNVRMVEIVNGVADFTEVTA
jgi:hypothetical protein